jgi:hypothetical protein
VYFFLSLFLLLPFPSSFGVRSPTTGDVVTLAGLELRLWTLNGALRAMVSLLDVPRLRRPGQRPTAAVATGGGDWLRREGAGVALGHASGEVSLWRIAPMRKRPTKEGPTGTGTGGTGAGTTLQQQQQQQQQQQDKIPRSKNENKATAAAAAQGGAADIKGIREGEAGKDVELLECERRGQKPPQATKKADGERPVPVPLSLPLEELMLCSLLPTDGLHRGQAITALAVGATGEHQHQHHHQQQQHYQQRGGGQDLVVGDAAGLVTRWTAARLDQIGDAEDVTSLLLHHHHG